MGLHGFLPLLNRGKVCISGHFGPFPAFVAISCFDKLAMNGCDVRADTVRSLRTGHETRQGASVIRKRLPWEGHGVSSFGAGERLTPGFAGQAPGGGDGGPSSACRHHLERSGQRWSVHGCKPVRQASQDGFRAVADVCHYRRSRADGGDVAGALAHVDGGELGVVPGTGVSHVGGQLLAVGKDFGVASVPLPHQAVAVDAARDARRAKGGYPGGRRGG